LEKQFPGDAEILRIQNALRDDQSQQRKLQALEQARKLLSSKNYENCVALLTSLHTEFADDQEIPKLLESARKEQVNERKRVAVADARNLLAARNYQQAVAFLNKLQSEFQNDTAIAKLLESARKEQADQRQREGLAEARKLLAARRYDESIVLLGKLAAEFPDESDITKLLATAREDLAERQKQQKLAEAKNLLAAQSFDQALSILDQLATAHSKDSAVTKLHALVQREQEEHTKAETIQRELDALKKLMGDKKYPEVIARTKELLHQFPTEPNFTRLAEFAASRQASIEKDLLLQKVLGEAQTLFNAGRFDECLRSAQSGLKMFPANADLQNFCQQAEIQRKKLQVRKQIEQRIREIRVKINREELSDAVDLAKQTLVTLGPDTDLTHLLNSAQVELEAREKKRIQERTLETIRTLIDSGDLDGASRTIDKVVESHTLDVFDPRIQRLADRIKDAKSAPAANPAKTPLTASPTFSKEYAFLQATPLPTAPPSPAQTPVDSAATNAPISASITSTPQYVAPDTAATTPPAREVTPEPPLAVPDVQKFQSVSPVAPVAPIVVPPSRPAAPVPRKVERPAPQPVSVPLWKKPAVLAIAALVLIAAIWFGLRSTPNPVVTDATKPAQPQPPAPAANPLELQQRQALEAADKLVAANDFDRALRLLQQAQALNGPLAPEIQKKSAEIVESKNNAGLRQIRQHEAELWQQALRSFRDKRYAEAQKALKGILALPAGGVRREEAQGYLEKNIPQQQAQDALSLQARKSLAQGDFASARRAAGQLSESGGNSADLIASINQAEQSQLKQLESQFDQLKQRDDDSAIQQLRALQPKLQALAADGGPRSGEALTYANSIPGAVADVRTHAEKKSADASFQQMVQRYQSAATSNDRDGLTAARGDFQSVVQNAGVHADEARKFISDINARLFALNRPPVTAPQPSVSPEPPPPVATNPNAADEASIRSALDQFNRAFAHKSEGEVKAIWPKVVKKYLQGMNEPGYTFSMALSPIGVITIAGDRAYVACNLVSTTTKPGGQKDQFTKTVRVELQKTGDHWLIVNPLEPNP